MHPDVKRMLMQMRALTAAARTICYATAVALDISVRAKDAKVRADAAARGALLTPIAKAFSTDIGNEVASLGVQIHGGMGFIEETGAAQHYRDARITPIYEGTNGIQSIDLVTRKLAANGGAVGVGAARRTRRHRQAGRGLERSGVRHHRRQAARRARLARARQQMAAGARDLGAERCARRRHALSAAVRLDARRLHAGRRSARRRAIGEAGGDPQRYVTLARFFAENITVQAGALEKTVTDSAEAVNGADAVLLG